MFSPNISTVIKQYEGFGGSFLDSQYLGAAYDAGKPHVLETMMHQIYASTNRYFDSKNLFDITVKGGNVKTVELDNDIYRYRMLGDTFRHARIVENLEVGNLTPGINLTPFKVKLDLDYMHHPDVVMGDDPELPAQIIDTIPEGNGTIYTLKLQGDRPDVYWRPDMLTPGKKISKVWSSVTNEANSVFGTQQTGSSFMLENQIGHFGLKLTVTDKALRDGNRLGIDFVDTKTGQKVSKFVPYYEAQMTDLYYTEVNAQLLYGVKGTQIGPFSKYPIRTGPGVRAQLKDSWQEYINGPITVNTVKDFLLDISSSRNGLMNRKFDGICGEVASVQWHDALVNLANGFMTLDTTFIKPTKSEVSSSALQYGAQFTKYIGPVGLEVTLGVEAAYDSDIYCKRMHPLYPNKPVDSARITFLNIAQNEGMNNIMMLKLKDSFLYGTKLGTIGPNGPIKNGIFGDLVAEYTVAIQGSAGVLIQDPSCCGEIIYDFIS